MYRFDDFLLDPVRRSLTRGGDRLSITPKQFDTLEFLVQRAGHLVTKEEMLSALWPGSFVEESNLSQNVFWLRKALGQTPENCYILTVPGHGYRFAVPVAETSDDAAGGAVVPDEASRQEQVALAPFASDPAADRAAATASSTDPRRLPVWAPAAAAALFLAAGLGAWQWSVRAKRPSGAPHPASNDVVLGGFVNSTGDASFDETLQQALRIDIEQSPYLSVLSPQQVDRTLAQMGRDASTPLTPSVAVEVCKRNQIKAVLTGTVAKLGSLYVVSATARSCDTGRTFATGKAQASSKEGVLVALDGLSEDLRRKLGESLASIQQHDVPMEQATTPSFGALRDYSLGMDLRNHGNLVDAAAAMRKAIALDPNFAMAHSALGAIYATMGESRRGADEYKTAYDLRKNATEPERFFIEAHYYRAGSGELDKAFETYKLWSRLYPREAAPLVLQADQYTQMGQYALAIDSGRQAVAVGPNVGNAYIALARAYKRASRFAEAEEVCRASIARGLAASDIHDLLLQSQVGLNDQKGAQETLSWWRSRQSVRFVGDFDEANIAFKDGRFHLGRELYARGVREAIEANVGDEAWINTAVEATYLSEAGFADDARSLMATIPASARVDPETAIGYAAAGDASAAMKVVDRLRKRYPHDTLLEALPVASALADAATRRGHPQAAIGQLRACAPYELVDFVCVFTRGQAYLALGDGARAAAEFNKILLNPGLDPYSVYYPLAQLDLARSLALAGDRTGALRGYRQFLLLWKGADEDAPALKQARRELAALAAGRAPAAKDLADAPDGSRPLHQVLGPS